MFFSRVTAEPYGLSPREMFELYGGNAYGDHQLLWRLFDSEKREFLFRREQSGRRNTSVAYQNALPIFYVVSQQQPKQLKGFRVESKPYMPKLVKGMKLGFNLRVNPVKAKIVEKGKKSVRNSVVHWAIEEAKEQSMNQYDKQALIEQALKDWLLTRAENAGIHIESEHFICDRYEVNNFSKRDGKRRQKVTIATVDYDGLLTVTDPELFRGVLYSGIGRARAFGCGMMMVRQTR